MDTKQGNWMQEKLRYWGYGKEKLWEKSTEEKEESQSIKRTNDEPKSLYKKPLISQIIRSQRIGWSGHITRMEGYRLTKQTLTERVNERRDEGRSRTTWIRALK